MLGFESIIFGTVKWMCISSSGGCGKGSREKKKKVKRDEIKRWYGFPGPKLQIYWITYRGPLTYIRLWNGVLPLDSVSLQGENST